MTFHFSQLIGKDSNHDDDDNNNKNINKNNQQIEREEMVSQTRKIIFIY